MSDATEAGGSLFVDTRILHPHTVHAQMCGFTTAGDINASSAPSIRANSSNEAQTSGKQGQKDLLKEEYNTSPISALQTLNPRDTWNKKIIISLSAAFQL